MDDMEDDIEKENCIVEHHDARPFPERWFSLIVVLRTSTEAIYDRLSGRFFYFNK